MQTVQGGLICAKGNETLIADRGSKEDEESLFSFELHSVYGKRERDVTIPEAILTRSAGYDFLHDGDRIAHRSFLHFSLNGIKGRHGEINGDGDTEGGNRIGEVAQQLYFQRTHAG